MCTVVLPPVDNPIAINKYINININMYAVEVGLSLVLAARVAGSMARRIC